MTRVTPGWVRGWVLTLAVTAAASSPASGETIVQAHYQDPVERYGHFALGRPHEYARLAVRTSGGRNVVFELPEDEVFEDLEPRLVRLESGAAPVLLSIVSSRGGGGRLVLLKLADGALSVLAQSPPIGTPNRWLNPVGVADLDGDGYAEVAAVITPHIGGWLTVYRVTGDRLQVISRDDGYSNHLYGSPQLDLSLPVSLDGVPLLVVPEQTRRHLRAMALDGGELREVARCALGAPINGPLREVSPGVLEATTVSGAERIQLDRCTVR
jgi:hypothetical protein